VLELADRALRTVVVRLTVLAAIEGVVDGEEAHRPVVSLHRLRRRTARTVPGLGVVDDQVVDREDMEGVFHQSP
jgi:enhancing lycopene biosynthesis protein 2